jgi:hypothetical protein
MSSLANSLRLWVVKRGDISWILAPGATGLPEPVQPEPILYRATYVEPHEVHLEVSNMARRLDSSPILAWDVGRLEAAIRTVVIFVHDSHEVSSYGLGKRAHQGPAEVFLAATPAGSYSWESALSQGEFGFFLFGSPHATGIWRIVRREVDYAGRSNFVLRSMALPDGLPTPDFALVTDLGARKEIEQHWNELVGGAHGHAYYAVVTSAKQVAENLLYHYLMANGVLPKKTSLKDLTMALRKVLEAQSAPGVPLKWLDYHLIEKLRLMHGRIHAGRVAGEGPIEPELALTTITDLIQVLRSAGLVKESR